MTYPMVKICGFTRPDQARAAADLGVDLIGVVLAPSARKVSIDQASRIFESLPPEVGKVVVLVSPSLEILKTVCRNLRPDYVQLHGAETADFCRLSPVPIIKALVVSRSFSPDKFLPYRETTAYYLIDSGKGSGKTLPWEELCKFHLPRPFFLAGGITPENVSQAIILLKPDGVDCSTGVETAAGIKDLSKIERLINVVKGGTP